MSKKISSVIGIGLIVVILGFLFVKKEGSHVANENISPEEAATTTKSGTGSFNTTPVTASYSVIDKSNEPVKVQPPQGVLSRTVTGAKQPLIDRVKVLQDTLTKNPNSLSDWLELGVLYKNANDYEGARLAWEYAGVIRPSNVASFTNLGDLYQYYIKDFPKAEEAMNQAIKNDPTLLDGYMRLFNLYALSYKTETTLATDTLRKGIERNPNGVLLMIALGDYYKGREAYPMAKMSYEQALSVAKASNNTDQIAEITNLIKALP